MSIQLQANKAFAYVRTGESDANNHTHGVRYQKRDWSQRALKHQCTTLENVKSRKRPLAHSAHTYHIDKGANEEPDV